MRKHNVKSYIRRSRKGKLIKVRTHTRSLEEPKNKHNSANAGKEYEHKAKSKTCDSNKPHEEPTMSKEELRLRKEVLEGFKSTEKERRELGMSRERYTRYKLAQNKAAEKNAKSKRTTKNTTTIHKRKLDAPGKFEDAIARFVEKYSGRKYKRQL